MPKQYTGGFDEAYWQWLHSLDSHPQDAGHRALQQAQAFTAALPLPEHARILDYGCGRGELTAALRALGYDALGVDVSAWPVEHCVPAATGHVQTLGAGGLAAYGSGSGPFDLAIAKDVFEHISQAQLPALVDSLLQLSTALIFICPVTGSDHRFICPGDNDDATHITRLTREEWLGLFPSYRATPLDAVTHAVRGPENEHGSVCVLLRRAGSGQA